MAGLGDGLDGRWLSLAVGTALGVEVTEAERDGAIEAATEALGGCVAGAVALDIGVAVGAGGSLPSGTTEIEPLFGDEGSLTTIRRASSGDPNTVDAVWSRSRCRSTVGLASSHG